jgi:chromosome segregation ATPase
MRENEMSERKCPVCGEIMIHTDLTDMDRCNNPTCGDMHVLIPPNYQTYADRLTAQLSELQRCYDMSIKDRSESLNDRQILAARVAELERELKSEKEQGIWWAGQCGKSDANANDLRRELAAAKAENERWKRMYGEMKNANDSLAAAVFNQKGATDGK